MPPVDHLIQSGLDCHQAGDLARAEQFYHQALHLVPGHHEALHLLGVLAHQQDQHETAINLINQAIAKHPTDPRYHNNLGEAYRGIGRFPEAQASYHEAIRLEPDYADAIYNLGNVQLQQGRFAQAVDSYQRAIGLEDHHVEAWTNMGVALLAMGQTQQAIRHHEQAIRLNPLYVQAHNNLGVALLRTGAAAEAIGCFETVLRLDSGVVEARNNLGKALLESARVPEAITSFREAVRLDPDFAEAHSNLLFTLHYDPSWDNQALWQEHREWADRHAQPLTRAAHPHHRDQDRSRKLRVGYVSPDLRDHAVAFFLEPLLSNHDRSRFTITCYSDVTQPDETTRRLHDYTDGWKSLVGLSDEDAAELIRRDEVDVLVDLSGHTAENRLLMFARRPAPVQVSYLGYPYTTGMTAMGYRFTDAHLDPVGMTDRYYTEQLVRLDGCFLCYRPPDDSPPINELPALTKGYVTFASFNGAYKITEAAVDAWSRLLAMVPGSRLNMLIGGGQAMAQRFTAMFCERGVDPGRITFLSKRKRGAYLRLFHDIDIALDPFPYNGQTTTCDCLWMGVPVVSLAGGSHVSRMGVSLLSNVGLNGLASDTVDGYLQVAASLACDLPRLSQTRSSLRQKMSSSALTDGQRLTTDIEKAYRDMCNRSNGA